jgi:hypothetical protein
LRTNRAPLYEAKKRLQEVKRRSLICVPLVGYRVPHATEHVEMAGDRWARAGRQLNRARGELNGTDFTALSPEEKQRNDDTRRQNTALQQEVRLHKRILARHERWLENLQGDVDTLKKQPKAEPPTSPEDIRRMIREEMERQARGE